MWEKKKNTQNKAAVQDKLTVWLKAPACKSEVAKLKGATDDLKHTLEVSKVEGVKVIRAAKPVAIKGGVYTGYRGDTRSDTMIRSGGFDLWPQSKKHLKNGIAEWFQNVVFPDPKFKDGGDFAEYVREQKNQDRPTISTSLDTGCGGYASNIYKFCIKGLQKYPMNEKVMGQPVPWKKPLSLYLDQPTIKAAGVVAIDLELQTFEVAFLTQILPRQVLQWKKGQKGTWIDMW